MSEEPTSTKGSATGRRVLATLLAESLAVAVGCGIAWVDTRPNWDDAGVTAGVLLLGGGLAAVLGLRWWLAALLVACPIVLAEHRSAGWSILLMLGFAAAGSALGAALRVAQRAKGLGGRHE
jgi:hypothetical protein